jgi:hypothetical protein
VHVFDPRFCGLLQHACDPNVFLDMGELWLWALKDIQKGDWLTIDYAATEDKLLRQFACQCGSYKCRGWITGYNESPNADGQAFYSAGVGICSTECVTALRPDAGGTVAAIARSH